MYLMYVYVFMYVFICIMISTLIPFAHAWLKGEFFCLKYVVCYFEFFRGAFITRAKCYLRMIICAGT